MSDAISIVQAFIETWRRRDVDAMVDACAANIVYQNVPTPPLVGQAALHAFMSVNMPKCDAFESQVLAIAATPDGTSVLTERLDAFVFGPNRIDVPVMGAFDLQDGKIAAWRDYFDVSTYTQKMRAAGADAGPGITEHY